MNRVRILETSVALLLLSTVIVIFVTPPEWISNVEETSPIGTAIGAGVWFLPPLLSGLVLYQKSGSQFQFRFLLSGGVSVGILLLFLVNLYTVYQSEGVLTYDGRGAFVGPILGLFAGSFLAIFVLVRRATNGFD